MRFEFEFSLGKQTWAEGFVEGVEKNILSVQKRSMTCIFTTRNQNLKALKVSGIEGAVKLVMW